MLCANPKTNVAAKNNRKSRGKLLILFIVLLKMVTGLSSHYTN